LKRARLKLMKSGGKKLVPDPSKRMSRWRGVVSQRDIREAAQQSRVKDLR